MRLHEQLGGPEPDDEVERELARLRRARESGGERRRGEGADDGFEGAEYRVGGGGGGVAAYALFAAVIVLALALWRWARAEDWPW